MGMFKSKKVAVQPAQTDMEKEKEETKVNKARLLGTEGENKGAELNQAQGASIRKVFGN